MTIAICDDSMFQRKILLDTLTESGYQVIQFDKGQKLLDHIQSDGLPDLTILDLLMPEKQGNEILKEIKDFDEKANVVILSADIQESKRKECMDLGASAFLQKPVSKEVLKSTIESLTTTS